MLKPKKSSKKVKLREDGNNYVTKGKVNSKGEFTDVEVRRTIKGLVTGAPSVKKAEKMSKMKKGGMSCSCGKGSCMKCGGKKYQDGGKKKVTDKKVIKENGKTTVTYNSTHPTLLNKAGYPTEVTKSYNKRGDLLGGTEKVLGSHNWSMTNKIKPKTTAYKDYTDKKTGVRTQNYLSPKTGKEYIKTTQPGPVSNKVTNPSYEKAVSISSKNTTGKKPNSFYKENKKYSNDPEVTVTKSKSGTTTRKAVYPTESKDTYITVKPKNGKTYEKVIRKSSPLDNKKKGEAVIKKSSYQKVVPVKNSDGWAGKTVKSLTPSKTPVKKVVNTSTKKKVAPKK